VHIPGLLQTADHAREIFQQVVPALAPPAIEQRVMHRIKRQSVLHGTPPVPYTAVLHEAALRMKFGGPDVTRRQLKLLHDMSELAHITIRVIPYDAGAYPGSGQSVYYAHGPVPQLDTVHLDQSHGPVMLGAEDQLRKYRLLLDRMENSALEPQESRKLIRRIIDTL
jgi:hypothetical protein